MTTTTIPTTSITTTGTTGRTNGTTRRTARSLVRPGAAAAVAAAVTNLGVAAAARAADVSLEVPSGKEHIPAYAFAQVTVVCAAIGIALAAVLRRRSANPQRTFLVTTVALTLVSMVPPFIVDADLGTSLVLCATHAIAAAIVIPVLAARLPRVGAARR